MLKRIFSIICLLFSFLVLQSQPAGEPEINLSTPYNTVYGHLYYLQPDSYDPGKAAMVFDENMDSLQRVKLAIRLKQIYDGKGLYVRVNKIPQNSNYIDSTSNQAAYTVFPRELPQVYLNKVNDKWYYSNETVNAIPELHEEVYPFGADLLVNILPKFGQRKVLGLALWQYVGLLIILMLAILVHIILSRLIRPIVRRLTRSRLYPSLVPPSLIWTIARLVSVFLVLRIMKILLPALQLPVEAANFAVVIIQIVSTLLIVYIVLKILDVFMLFALKATRKTESKMDEQLMPVLKRGIQFVILLGGVVQILRELNVDITTLIAGISIGGLALALAAQDTLKNLFGSLTIFLDKPFQIGDWISFGGVDGTVEEVGFRSTRVRTFANSLVYVPNGKLADTVVNNYGLRQYRRFKTTISITYDTPPDLIEKFIEGLRIIIEKHPMTRKDYYEVHFNNMSATSLDILFYAFFAVESWSDELKGKQEILLQILRLGDALGVQFAFPTQTIHVQDFPGTTSSKPHYDTDPESMDKRLKDFLGGEI
ncbi:MAG: mechanosensitive ion channel family protein [Chitinophagales bacterium]|nr:mechanosensitive ion channel family protein [Chitinophagales bacterium]